MLNFSWKTIATGIEGPGPRSRHCLVYDRGAGATLLFGGIVWNAGAKLRSDTWELRDGEWWQVEGLWHPGARHRAAMVFDEDQGFSVLFGGQDRTGALSGETWIYADRRWRRDYRSWWNGPGARCGHMMAYDEDMRRTVLFGGIGNFDRTLGDTWTYDGASWENMRGPGPPARRYAAFTYAPNVRGCLLHGGAIDDRSVRQFGDSWLFRDGAWTQLPDRFQTDLRDDHGLAYHRAAKTMVMLEGVSGERGLLTASSKGWNAASCWPLHPRHQCSPLVWDDGLEGLVLHGGETGHGGAQFDVTLVLKLAPVPRGRSIMGLV